MKTGRWLAIAIVLGTGSATWAQDPAPKPQPQGAETWAGRVVVLKRPSIKVGHTDAAGKQVYVAELTSLSYLVKAEQEGYLQVEQRGAVGWFDKNEALLPDDAIRYFTQKASAPTANPKDGTPLAFLGWAYREKKDYPSAIKMYDQAIARQPTADWHNNRGILYLESRNYDKAIADFTEALRLKSDFLIALENRSIANQSASRPDPALADLAEVMRRDPKNAQHYARKARLHVMKRELKEAEGEIDQAVRLEPKNVDFLVQRGDLHAEQKQYAKAYDDYAAAAKLAPDDPEPLVHRSNVFVDEKKFPNALVDLDAALKLDPKNAEILIARGWVNLITGNYDATIADYEAAAKAEPKNPLVYNCRAWLWATCPEEKHRDGKKAEEFARKAIEMTEGKDPGFRDTLAAALAEQGRFDEAVKLQEAVVGEITQEPDAGESRARLDLYRQKKAYRQAIEKK